MKLMFRLTLSFLVVISFAGLTMAHDERLNLADFASNPAAFAGRTVEVQARVVAINADGQSLELYDSPTRTRISVQLAQLSKAERKALIRSDVREVLVRGQVSMVAGRLTIHAESVRWSDKEATK
jgi:hypothetical protein